MEKDGMDEKRHPLWRQYAFPVVLELIICVVIVLWVSAGVSNGPTILSMIVGLVGWLGLIWRDRISREEQTKSTICIESLKNNLDFEKQRGVFAHSLQFRKEFESYERLWDTLLPLYEISVKMRPEKETCPEDADFEDIKNAQVQRLPQYYNAFFVVFRHRRPFYCEEVYLACLKLQELARLELYAGKNYEGLMNADSEAFFAAGKENVKQMKLLVDQVADAIRKRIGTVLPSLPDQRKN